MIGPTSCVSRCAAITPLVSTIRGLLIGGPVAGPLVTTLAWMAGLLVVFVPLALRGYARRA